MSEIIAKIWLRIRPKASLAHELMQVEQAHTPGLALASVTPLASVYSGNGRLLNREISDLLFIERVMEEAANLNHPLFERVRFLSITADVLDQFYSVRVAKLRQSVARHDGYVTQDGLTAAQQLKLVSQKASDLMNAQQASWADLQAELNNNNIYFPDHESLSPEDKDWLSRYFRSRFLHVLTPFTIDEEHPFPFIPSGGLCAILELQDGFILLPLPANLARFIALPGTTHRFVTAESLIDLCWQDIVPDGELRSCGVFKILRDNDLAREEMNDDLRAIVESGLRMRHKANVNRLKISDTMSEPAVRFVAEHLGLLSRQELLQIEHRASSILASDLVVAAPMVGLSHIAEVVDELTDKFPGFVFGAHKPRYPAHLRRFNDDCFAAIQDEDMIAHWPYDSFDSVVRFVTQAANDRQVVAIKQTLYRTNDESPIVEALITAAKNGKTVLAVVELEARDNEQANVLLAKKMEAAGVQIVYGIIGLKIHCKATLVVRMEGGEAITYTHLGTGNYHQKNARM